MSIITAKGLSGLRGLSGLSNAARQSFIDKNRDLIAAHHYDPVYINQLYSNKQFIDRFGIDQFNAIPNMSMRNQLYKDDVVNEQWNKLYSPINDKGIRDNSIGLGADWEKYSQMSTDAKLKLMESGWKTPEEFNKFSKEVSDDFDDSFWSKALQFTPIVGIPELLKSADKALNTNIDKILAQKTLEAEARKKGLDYRAPEQQQEQGILGKIGSAFSGVDAAKNIYTEFKKNENEKLKESVYNDWVDGEANKLSGDVESLHLSDEMFALSDDKVKELAKKEIVPGSYIDSAGRANIGIPEFAKFFVEDPEGKDLYDKLTVDDMRKILAMKKVYYDNMNPDAAATALNNYAKRFLKDNQGFFERQKWLGKDILISATSYTADKVNGIYNVGLYAADKLSGPVDVWVDDRSEIVDPRTQFKRAPDGSFYYEDESGKAHPVHREQVSRTTLHNMGKNIGVFDPAGSDDTSWLNPQDWSRREAMGVWDKDIAEQYEKLGSSPYKVAYDPNEDTDLWYEAAKMASFGLADGIAQAIPFGIGLAGRTLTAASKVGSAASAMGKAMNWTGKMLTAETKFGRVSQGLAGAGGIAYAYQRGAFQETLAQNLANLEENLYNKSRNEIYEQYNSDDTYKGQVDALINAKAASMKADYIANATREGNSSIVDESKLSEMIHARAQEEVLGDLVNRRVAEGKNSKEYADMQEEAIRSAGATANTVFFPEAVKYGFVNTIGFRKWMYGNPASLRKRASQVFTGLREITTEAGKDRLVAEPSKFATRAQKIKQFGKTLGSQVWGGAWTNGTDDMMVDAAEQINEDSYNKYLNAYANGESLAEVYGFADGFFSYLNGLTSSLGQDTTWNAATVGGLGSIMSVTPNMANIIHYATKEGRKAFKEQFGQRYQYETDANGYKTVKRGEDGKPVVEELGWKDNWRERLNFFIQNGVLNTYYGNKQNEMQVQSHADYVNNILDDYEDFKAVEDLVESDMALDNVVNEGDEKTALFIKALNAVNALEHLGNSKNDPTTMSSVIENKKNFIRRAAKMSLDPKDEDSFTEEEVSDMLGQYYATTGITRSEEHDAEALQIIQKNAIKLQEAQKAYEEAGKKVNDAERSLGRPIDTAVKEKLRIIQALDPHWKERKKTMQDEIGDTSSDGDVSLENVIPTLGSIRNAQDLVKVYDEQKEDFKKEIEDQKTVVSKAKENLKKAEDKLKEVQNSQDSKTKYDAFVKVAEARNELEDAEAHSKYLNDLIAMADEKQSRVKEAISTYSTEGRTPKTILTSDEIFALDPVTRANMMRKSNRWRYSKEQIKEIEKLEGELKMKDPNALEKIQDIALLTQRIKNNQDANSRILEAPEAAAIQLEAQRETAADAAYRLVNARNAESVVKGIEQLDESPAVSQENKDDMVYKTLRQLNSDLIDIIDRRNLLSKYKKQLDDAKAWVDIMTDIDNAINKSGKEKEWKDNIRRNIKAQIESARNKEEVVKALEDTIDGTWGTQAADDFDYILRALEDVGYQRDATVLDNREKRKKREEEKKKKDEEERKKREEVDQAAIAKAQAEVEERKRAAENKPEVSVKADGSNIQEDIIEEETPENLNPNSPNSKLDGASETVSWDQMADLFMDKDAEDGTLEVGRIWQTYEGNPQKESLAVTKSGNKITFSVNRRDASLVVSSKDWSFERGKGDTIGLKKSDLEEGNKNTDIPFNVTSIERINDKWYFNGSFEGSDVEHKLRVKKGFNLDTLIESNKKMQESIAALNGAKTANIYIEEAGDTISGKSPSIEEQVSNDEGNKPKEVGTVGETTDPVFSNTLGEQADKTEDTNLSANPLYEWDKEKLNDSGILEHRKGKKPDDPMNTFFNWLTSQGIHLQNIIDTELGLILKKNPDARVRFVYANPNKHYDVQHRLFLALDYNDSINAGITSIHSEENGGVIESNGKKYLIIGCAGYGDINDSRNASRLAIYDILFSRTDKSAGKALVKKEGAKFFQKNPEEQFFISDEFSTEIVPNSLIPGYRVKQLESDSGESFRKLSEILSDKKRNPKNLSMRSLSFGIQHREEFVTVGARKADVMVPRDREENAGRAFVLIPAANGKYFPAYFKPLKYQEMLDGALKNKVNDLLLEVITLGDLAKRREAQAELSRIFYFDNQTGDNITLSKSRPEIYLVQKGEITKRFILDTNFNTQEFLDAFWDMNPRVNITTDVLQSDYLLEQYDEAGALQTDAALLHLAGSHYSIYGVDAQGNILKEETLDNSALGNTNRPTTPTSERERQVIFKQQTYKRIDGKFYLKGSSEPVTDASTIKQLEYNKQIVDNALTPIADEGTWEYYILSNGEHPTGIRVNRNTKEVKEISEQKAKELIDKVKQEEDRKRRNEAAKKELEDQIDQVAEEGVTVDILGSENLSDRELTPDNVGIASTETGEQSAESPAQPVAEKSAEEGSADKAPLEVPKDFIHREVSNTSNLSVDAGTQNFETLIKNGKYRSQISKAIKGKWPGAPTKISALKEFLQDKIEVNMIGTSEADIQAWIKTLEDCR